MVRTLVTILLLLLAIYVLGCRIEIPVAHSSVRGVRGIFSSKLLYTFTVPVVFSKGIIVNIYIFTIYWKKCHISMPPLSIPLLLDFTRLAEDVVFIILCIFFSYYWMHISGMDPKTVAHQIARSGMQIPGFRKSPDVLERILGRYIPKLALMSGLIVGSFEVTSRYLNSLIEGTAMLIVCSCAIQFYERICAIQLQELLVKEKEYKAEVLKNGKLADFQTIPEKRIEKAGDIKPIAIKEIRNPVVAGSFYPSSGRNLLIMLKEFIQQYNPDISIVAGIVPNAGYIFSGRIAGKIYSLIPQAETYVIICPNHTGYGSPVAVSTTTWLTPLGEVKVDTEFIEAMPKKIVKIDETAHKYEYAIEIQLPFLQYINVGKEFKIVPICIGYQDENTAKEIAKEIIEAEKKTGRKIVVLASSCMHHYLPDGECRKRDMTVIKSILSMNIPEYYKKIYGLQATVDGYGCIGVAMYYAKHHKAKAKLIDYSTSGDVVGDKSSVVGYAAIAFQKPLPTHLNREKVSTIELFIPEQKPSSREIFDENIILSIGRYSVPKMLFEDRNCILCGSNKDIKECSESHIIYCKRCCKEEIKCELYERCWETE